MVKETFGLEVEKFEVSKKGIIKGIAVNFNKPIMQGGMVNIISPTAFNRSLAEGATFPLLNQHNMQDPVGVVRQLKPVDGALRFEAQIAVKATSGVNVFALVEAGALSGVSIGFVPAVTRYGKDKQGRRVRYIDDIDFHELSLVTVPADKGAKIEVAYAEDFDEASVELDSSEPIGEFDAKGAFILLEERILKLEALLSEKEITKEANQEAVTEAETCSEEVSAKKQEIQALIDRVKLYDAELVEVIAS